MKNTTQKIQRKRLSDQVVDKLIAMIAKDELKAGEKLPSEPELMEQFGVGRSSIREAVGALELAGVLSVRPGDGTRVVDSSDMMQARSAGLSLLTLGREKIDELVEARVELEHAIAGIAAERATEEDLIELRRLQEVFLQSDKRNEELLEADIEFHSAVAKASHNAVLIRFFMEIKQPVRSWMEQKAKFDWGFEQVADEHEAIISALEARDVEKAKSAMRRHIIKAGSKLVAALKDV